MSKRKFTANYDYYGGGAASNGGDVYDFLSGAGGSGCSSSSSSSSMPAPFEFNPTNPFCQHAATAAAVSSATDALRAMSAGYSVASATTAATNVGRSLVRL